MKRKYISHNPMDGFEFPDRDDDIIEPPTVEEVQMILKNASPHLFQAIVLAYHTGLRPGEVEFAPYLGAGQPSVLSRLICRISLGVSATLRLPALLAS